MFQTTNQSICMATSHPLWVWLVVYLPLWNIWKSVGMIIPNIWKNKIDVPNHQPVNLYGYKPSTMSLVGGIPTPLKIWKSVGMIIPNIWKNKIDVPNHQPVNLYGYKPSTMSLVGGIPTPLKNMKSVGMIIPNIWGKKNWCSKPPTSQSVWLQAIHYESGWWYTYPSEKYESQLGWLSPIYGKIKLMFQTTNQSICMATSHPLWVWLVVYLPLWKIWKSVGMIIPNIWKNKIDVPNHQPVNLYGYKPSTMSRVGGIPTPLKNMKVSWDDYPQYMEKNKIDVPNHQPVNLYGYKPSTMSLVGGIPTPLKNMKVSWDDYPQYMEK